MLVKVLFVALAIQFVAARTLYEDDSHMHKHARFKRGIKRTKNIHKESTENSSAYWKNNAQWALNSLLHHKENTKIAKNVILFLGDGMSIPTLAAARAYQGQLVGKNGEETYLSFEEFPYTALSKTYCVDSQVADSACSATAYLCGVKANIGTIGVNGEVPLSECAPSMNKSTHVTSIARWSQLKKKWTGLVTTTRVTHASPTGIYANTADRDWESDYDVTKSNVSPTDCPDIAHQLIHSETGSNLHVIMGGGRVKMLPETTTDEEGQKGERRDGRNLVEEWKTQKANLKAEYVWNRNQLLNVSKNTDYLLGLFESGHCKYNLERTDLEPTLTEMTEAAIKILSKSSNGYFLFVEGGRIDHAHHDTLAKKALDETVQFSEAIRTARKLTSLEDTLIVVTSDHAHTMSVNGYPVRGNDILGIGGDADDDMPYATLSYSNGPGYRSEVNGKRHDIRNDNMHDNNYEYPALAPLSSETHGGDDVGIFASGPWAHLYRGVVEQNLIPHIMAYASCVGDGITACDEVYNKHKRS